LGETIIAASIFLEFVFHLLHCQKDVEHKIKHHNQDNQEDKQKKVEYEHGQWVNEDDMGKNAS
jgi:hypothetical protein